MKWFNYNFAVLFIFLAFQLACGQSQPNSNEKKIVVLTNEKRKSNTEVEINDRKPGAKEINKAYPNLKTQAEIMRKAFLAEDFDKYTDFMYPYLVEIVGGKEKFISGLRSTISNLRSNGVGFVSFEIGNPLQTIEMDNKVFVVLPFETKMKNPQRITTEEGNILAVSENQGERWKLIRATSKERFRFSFPQLVDRLSFAESKTK